MDVADLISCSIMAGIGEFTITIVHCNSWWLWSDFVMLALHGHG
jgi:hypothetical protein